MTPHDRRDRDDRAREGDSRPRALARRIEGEIESVRTELGDLVAELDRRRHELFDLRLQLRRHPLAATAAGVVVAATVGGVVAWAVWSRRRRRRPIERAREVKRALARILESPDEVARDPGMAEKALTVVATTAATILTKRLIERAIAGRPSREYQRARYAENARA